MNGQQGLGIFRAVMLFAGCCLMGPVGVVIGVVLVAVLFFAALADSDS